MNTEIRDYMLRSARRSLSRYSTDSRSPDYEEPLEGEQEDEEPEQPDNAPEETPIWGPKHYQPERGDV